MSAAAFLRRNTLPAQPAPYDADPDFTGGADPLEAVAHRITDETTRTDAITAMRTAIDTSRNPKEHNP